MLTSSISFVNFKKKINYTKVKKNLKLIIDNKNQNQVIKSLSKNYKYSFKKKKLDKYRKFSNFRVINICRKASCRENCIWVNIDIRIIRMRLPCIIIMVSQRY